MKTTVDIPDDLMKQAKALAAEENTTLRDLLIDALRSALSLRGRDRDFQLRDASVPGRGVEPGVTEGNWQSTANAIYEGRGS